MIIIMEVVTVLVLLHLDQIHLLLLVITTIVNLVIQDLLVMMHTTHQMYCGMDMVAIILITTAVPTPIFLGSSDNFHDTWMIIWKQGSAVVIHLIVKLFLWKVLNCTHSDILLTDSYIHK